MGESATFCRDDLISSGLILRSSARDGGCCNSRKALHLFVTLFICDHWPVLYADSRSSVTLKTKRVTQ